MPPRPQAITNITGHPDLWCCKTHSPTIRRTPGPPANGNSTPLSIASNFYLCPNISAKVSCPAKTNRISPVQSPQQQRSPLSWQKVCFFVCLGVSFCCLVIDDSRSCLHTPQTTKTYKLHTEQTTKTYSLTTEIQNVTEESPQHSNYKRTNLRVVVLGSLFCFPTIAVYLQSLTHLDQWN